VQVRRRADYDRIASAEQKLTSMGAETPGLTLHQEIVLGQADRNFPGTLGAVIVTFDPKIHRPADLALN